MCIASNLQNAFLSTLSLRRATARRASRQQPAGISIHALLAESDSPTSVTPAARRNFYPRSPCGERRRFLASLSAVLTISIHALLAESDVKFSVSGSAINDFYPRSPCGERPTRSDQGASAQAISIHALLAESDCFDPVETLIILPFLSTLSLRRATPGVVREPAPRRFLSTLSLRRATTTIPDFR